jgi:D-alanine--poly(phosphoribitol) ligase subunit 1
MQHVDNVIKVFEKIVSEFPENVAVKEGGQSITFLQLRRHALIIAKYIIENNVDPHKPIVIFLPKSLHYLEVIVGILYSANFYVPIDFKTPGKRLEMILKNTDPSLIITHSDYKDNLSKLNQKAGFLFIDGIDQTQIIADGTLDLIKHRQDTLIDTDPVYMIYTSGSTGIPKGVLISHRSVIDYISWAANQFQIDSTTVIGNQSPFYFDNSTLDIYLCLMCGATFVVIPEANFIYPANLIEYLNTHKINFIFWVPSVLVNIANLEIFKDILPGHLNKVLFAGEVMPVKHLNYWRKHIPQATYANLYGPTEITVDCTYYIVDREFKENESLPIGFPCHNTSILILNEDNQPAKENETGELCVRGSSLALGYYNDFDKTSKAFCQNPLNTKYPERIYRTGDMVSLNSRKEIIFYGRKDYQIKHMGYRIELGEIENALLSIEEINNACVVYEENRKQIIAFYISRNPLKPGFLKEAMSKLLPTYMVPRVLENVDSFPLNANGKIDRLALFERLKK